MNIQRRLDETEFAVTTYESENGTELAVDFGPSVQSAVDIVGETAIVVVDDDQYEFELDTENAQAFITNGVLSIEVNG